MQLSRRGRAHQRQWAGAVRACVKHAGGQPLRVPEQHPGLPKQLQRQQLLPCSCAAADACFGAQLRAERHRVPELAQLLGQVQVAV